MLAKQQYRLLTIADFDGLACAALLKEVGLVDQVRFVHPQDMLNGTVFVDDEDVLANLPYVPGCHLAFDRHLSEMMRLDPVPKYIYDTHAPSTARVIFSHYGGEKRFPDLPEGLLDAVDRLTNGKLAAREVLNPEGYTLLNFIMDPRTGLGRFHKFRISNYQLMVMLVDELAKRPVSEILELPDVKERVDLYRKEEKAFQDQLKRCTRTDYHIAIVDYRGENVIHAGNRYVVFALFPDCAASVHVLWGLNKKNTVLAVNKSLFFDHPDFDVTPLMAKYGGGGLKTAGTIQLPSMDVDKVLQDIVETLDPKQLD